MILHDLMGLKPCIRPSISLKWSPTHAWLSLNLQDSILMTSNTPKIPKGQLKWSGVVHTPRDQSYGTKNGKVFPKLISKLRMYKFQILYLLTWIAYAPCTWDA